jgi:hypothetical protein
MGIDVKAMNNYGRSLVGGHSQSPVGMRLVIEYIGEVAIMGFGRGPFVGCAAGDTAAGVVVKVC